MDVIFVVDGWWDINKIDGDFLQATANMQSSHMIISKGFLTAVNFEIRIASLKQDLKCPNERSVGCVTDYSENDCHFLTLRRSLHTCGSLSSLYSNYSDWPVVICMQCRHRVKCHSQCISSRKK